MTAINSWLSPTFVAVMTDTLATTEDYRPAGFFAKAYPVPQIDALISGRGSSELIAGWAFEAACRTLVADYDILVELATPALARRWQALEGKRPDTTTAFAWGWSPRESRFIGYAFRSGSDFAPERLDDGIRFAPGLADQARCTALMDQPDQVAGMLAVMLAAAEEGRADPVAPEQCQIGGEVILYLLQRDDAGSVSTTSRIIHRFPNRDADYFEALRTNGFRP